MTQGLPFLLAISITLIAYRRALQLTNKLPQELIETYNIDSKKLMLYPAAQILMGLPLFIYGYISPWTGFNFTVLLICLNIMNLNGFANFLVYGGLLIQQRRILPINSPEQPKSLCTSFMTDEDIKIVSDKDSVSYESDKKHGQSR